MHFFFLATVMTMSHAIRMLLGYIYAQRVYCFVVV